MPRHTDIDAKTISRRCSTVVPSQIGSHEVYSHPLLRLWQNQIILPSLLVAALVSPQIRVVQNLLRLSGDQGARGFDNSHRCPMPARGVAMRSSGCARYVSRG